VTRGVRRSPEAVSDLAGRCAALLSACPDETVIAGQAAAQLHGLWLPEPASRRIELILRSGAEVPRKHAGSRRREIRGRRRVVLPDEVVVVAGVPLTSQARTWLDLAEFLAMPDIVAAGDCVLRGDTSRDELQRVLGRAYHRRGVVRARAAFAVLNPRSRSRPESHLRYALISARLPEPMVNRAIYNDAGEWLAEPDLHYKDARLALEYNGAVHASPQQMRRDFTRDIDIQYRGGWRTVTFGPAEVFNRPEQTASFVRQLIRERAPEMLRRPA